MVLDLQVATTHNGLGPNSQMQGPDKNNQTGNLNSNSSKWIINLSKISLTKAHESLLKVQIWH